MAVDDVGHTGAPDDDGADLLAEAGEQHREPEQADAEGAGVDARVALPGPVSGAFSDKWGPVWSRVMTDCNEVACINIDLLRGDRLISTWRSEWPGAITRFS